MSFASVTMRKKSERRKKIITTNKNIGEISVQIKTSDQRYHEKNIHTRTTIAGLNEMIMRSERSSVQISEAILVDAYQYDRRNERV